MNTSEGWEEDRVFGHTGQRREDQHRVLQGELVAHSDTNTRSCPMSRMMLSTHGICWTVVADERPSRDVEGELLSPQKIEKSCERMLSCSCACATISLMACVPTRCAEDLIASRRSPLNNQPRPVAGQKSDVVELCVLRLSRDLVPANPATRRHGGLVLEACRRRASAARVWVSRQ